MIWSGFGSANAWGCERFTLSSSHSHLQAKRPRKQPTPGWTFHWDGVNVALRMPGASPTLCISPEYVTKRRFWDSSGPHLGQFWQPAQLLSCYSACCEPWDEPATSHHACLSPATARLPGETSATALYSTTTHARIQPNLSQSIRLSDGWNHTVIPSLLQHNPENNSSSRQTDRNCLDYRIQRLKYMAPVRAAIRCFDLKICKQTHEWYAKRMQVPLKD